jgi:hypothetical protein
MEACIVNEHIRKLIAHSSECNINGYGYCDCGADPDRYLSEKDVNDILKSHNEVIEHLTQTIKLERNTKQKSGKEWVGLTTEESSELYNKNYDLYDTDMTFMDFFTVQREVEAKLKEKNT